MDNYGDTALPGYLKVMDAISDCRTPAVDELYVGCSECNHEFFS